MNSIKTIISTIAIILTFVGYIPYIRDTLKGKTKPHIYSWFIWGLVTLIAFGLQLSEGGGTGSLVTLAAALASFFIFVLGLRAGDKDIVTSDKVFLLLSIAALAIWIFAEEPIISIILISIVNILGFVPTIRKSWKDPYSETLFTYLLNTFRHTLAIFALAEYNIVTYLYPVTWVIVNGLFGVILIIRRKQVKN